MIVCVCGNVSSRKVEEAIHQGAATLEDLQMALGVCCQCCCCEEFLMRTLEIHKAN